MPTRAGWGEAQAWVRAVAASQTDECLIWPFLSQAGQVKRPVIGHGGHAIRPVTHAVLEAAGRPLDEGQQANHICDEPWCCNPRHLYIGTQHDNIRDAVARGRMNGLSDDVVAEIVSLSRTMGYKRIAQRLGISFYAARYHARKARKAAI